MKHKKALVLLLVTLYAATSFVACGNSNSASTSQSTGSTSQSTTNSTSASSSSSAAVSTSESVSSSASASTTEDVKTVQQTMTVYVNGTNERAVVALQIPETWEQNGSYTLAENDIKVLEIFTLYPITDPQNPITTEMKAMFDGTSEEGMMVYPEGYGLQSAVAASVNGRDTLCYLFKTWPDDSDKPWYPHYYFYVLDDYVLQVHFFSFDETADDALFEQVLGSVEIFF